MSADDFPVPGVLVLTPMLGVTLLLLPLGVPPSNTKIIKPVANLSDILPGVDLGVDLGVGVDPSALLGEGV